jgi:hypothetical protein
LEKGFIPFKQVRELRLSQSGNLALRLRTLPGLSGLTSIPTLTHIVPVVSQRLVKMALPRPRGFDQRRELWVPEEIDAVLAGDARPLGFTDTKFASCRQLYIAGMFVSGSVNGDPHKRHPNFERLENVDEVWVMCFRAPHDNQWRLMGRFVEPNKFVGLALFSRRFLNGRIHYEKQATEFASRWPTSEKYFVGTKIEDYISQPVRDPYVPKL